MNEQNELAQTAWWAIPGDGQMDDTWRGVETSTRTGETDQSVTPEMHKVLYSDN